VLVLAAGAAGCADRALAAAAPAEPPAATDLALAVETPEGRRLELAAESARLEPGFPGVVAGTFEEAAFRPVASPGDAASAASAAGEAPSAPQPADDESFSVRARRMHYDSRNDSASFSGDVRLEMGDYRLSCDSLEVVYHRAEGTVDFDAAGTVRVERPGLVATAGKAQFRGADGRLTLTESPRVEGDVGVLEGARIVLSVPDGSVTVDDVRGTFRMRRP
jgi:lipopolysaccharide transport protein LptA